MVEELKEDLYLYNLLRHLFLKEPDKSLLKDLAGIAMPKEADDSIAYGLKMMIDFVKNNEKRLDALSEELAIEYARLFIGPLNPPAIPYASFYLSESRLLMTDETIDVRKKYLDAGMAVKELYRIPDDHIGIELEFIYYLTQKIIEAREQGQSEEASRLLKLREEFLWLHFSKWAPKFADAVIASAKGRFYQGAALALKGCVHLLSNDTAV